LGIIEEEADRLSELINNLLDVSRLNIGGLTITMTPFHLPHLVERAVQSIAATAGDEFEFQLRFPSSFPLVVGDENRVRMVLNNLLTNAVKYSPTGGVIRVGGWVEGSEALVYVSDQGIGVAPEDRERIFDRFYRADNTLSRSTQGTGLGLYLAKVIVEAHGGRIFAEAQPQHGTRFVFTLPVDLPQLSDATSATRSASFAVDDGHPRVDVAEDAHVSSQEI
jgi:signal transduction histidine kinase